MESNVIKLLSAIPNFSNIFAGQPVKNACNNTFANLMLSQRLYITVASVPRFSSSFASIQGQVSSIYLFARRMIAQMLSIASGIKRLSTFALILSSAPVATSIKLVSNSVAVCGAGIVPPKYCSTIAVVRETRLPKSFTKSLFILDKKALFEYIPS